MNKKINTFLFWLFLHTPEKLHKLFPDFMIRRIEKAANQKRNEMQQDITRLKWRLAQKQSDLYIKEKKV